MSNDVLGLLLDCVVLLFLGATIVYAYRLSKNLQDFKAHRSEFDSIIANLVASIDKSERAIYALKQASAEEAGRLEGLIRQAKSLSDELGIINDAGESLAGRLESLAEQSSKIVRGQGRGEDVLPVKGRRAASAMKNDADIPSFMKKGGSVQAEEEIEDNGARSQAERELLAALRANNRKTGGRQRK